MGQSGRTVNLNIHLNMTPNLRASGAVPLLPAAFVAWCLLRTAVALSVPIAEQWTHTDNADWLCR